MSLYKFFPKIPKITKSTSKEILNSASELIAQPAQASPSTTTENPIQITIETVIEKPQSEEISALRRIFNYTRTTMSLNRLGNLSLLAIESDLLDDISNNDVIDCFATNKPRKLALT